ncbi:MAG: cyclic nucleotide-binding domain-containing protein [Actinomycetota bacterium]
MTSKHVQRVAALPLFSGLDTATLEAVAAVALPFDAPAGHNLIEPGLVGSGVFLFEDGQAVLEIHDHTIEIGPGEIVGELACLDERAVHTGRVHTTTAVRGLCIRRDEFIALLETHPAVAVPLLRILAARLVNAIARD